MKFNQRFFLLFFLFIPFKFTIAQEALVFLDETISFQRPVGVTLWEERPDFTTVQNYSDFWLGKIRLKVDIYDEEAIKNTPYAMPRSVLDLISEKGHLFRNDLLSLFSAKSEFVIFNYLPRVYIRNSYKSLKCNNLTIGETMFHTNALNLEAHGNYGYTTSVIVENKIVNIYLSLFTGNVNNPLRELKNFSTVRNGLLCWKDDKSIVAFYEQLSSNQYKEMSLLLQQLRDANDLILKTLEIKQNVSSRRMNVEIISPDLVFWKTHITTDSLRLRERESITAPTILTLPKGTDVQVIGSKWEELTETIDGITAPWVKVTTKDGYVGWCFSGYLREIR